MLTLHGTILNVFETPEGVSKDGEKFGGGYRVQIMVENVLKNGSKRMDMITLTTDDPEAFKKLLGRPAAVPVGAFASGTNVQFYIRKQSDGPKPLAAGSSAAA